jgi:hypothetical protein
MNPEKVWRFIVDACRVSDTLMRILDRYWP